MDRKSADYREWLEAEYGRGRSMSDIAEEASAYRSTIARDLKRFGIHSRPGGRIPQPPPPYSDNSYSVYVHIFPNRKRYFGLTKSKPQYRWSGQHDAYKGCTVMYRAILKYGWDNIRHEVLFTGLSKAEAEAKEIELIALHRTTERQYGYNLSTGGKAAHGVQRSDETRARMSAAKRKAWADPEYRKSRERARIEGNHIFGVARVSADGSIAPYECIADAMEHTGATHDEIIDSIFSNNGKWLFQYTILSKAYWQTMEQLRTGGNANLFEWLSLYYEEALLLGTIEDENVKRSRAYLRYKIENPPELSYRKQRQLWECPQEILEVV